MQLIYNFLKNLFPVANYRKCRLDNDILIVMNKDLSLHYLNETATFFLKKSKGEFSISEIEQQMLQEYAVDKYLLENDIVDIVRDLQWKKIITLSKTRKCKGQKQQYSM